jgi:hypothetical protein
MPDRATLGRWLRKASTQSPARTARALGRRIASNAAARRARVHDATHRTYLPSAEAPAELARYLSEPAAPGSLRRQLLERLADEAIAHRFDLLGSGSVVVAHGAASAGFDDVRYPPARPVTVDPAGRWLAGLVSAPNADESAKIWRLVDPGYVPVDWQLDFKSGWRWSALTWSRDIEFGDRPGADIKVPWERARLQHLPRLAMLGGARHALEFRNQTLDFVASNPPRFGVNWVTAMDVAIRAVNLLVANDLFRAAGTEFDEAFEAVLRRSILEHGHHIASHLEWSEERGNHYLADITGLLFIAAYLPETPETLRWRDFASAEVISELRRQFHAEGTNIEGSIAYHRLSGEMAAYAAAILLRLVGPSAIPPEIASRLVGMAVFAIDVTKPDGRVPLIGDNDSGRFVNLGPIDEADAGDRDHRALVGTLNGILRQPGLKSFADGAELEAWLVEALAGSRALDAAAPNKNLAVGSNADVALAERWVRARAGERRRTWRIALPDGVVSAGITQVAYPSFGLYVFRGPRIYLSVRCGSLPRHAPTGHAHNDQLSIELQVDGIDWIRDPGSVTYTPDPVRRNAYRSMSAHFGPRLQLGEPSPLDRGVFELTPPVTSRCRYWGPQGFAGDVRTSNGRVIVARVQVGKDVVLVDWASDGDSLSESELEDDDWRRYQTSLPFSPAYGRLENSEAARVP